MRSPESAVKVPSARWRSPLRAALVLACIACSTAAARAEPSSADWARMNPSERHFLAPLSDQWDALPAQTRRKLRARFTPTEVWRGGGGIGGGYKV